MSLPPTLEARIREMAEREGTTPEAFIEYLLDEYTVREAVREHDPIEDIIGSVDINITDLSVTVKESLRRKFRNNDSAS